MNAFGAGYVAKANFLSMCVLHDKSGDETMQIMMFFHTDFSTTICIYIVKHQLFMVQDGWG